ncbi:MAG: hypothetical protein ACK4HF_11820 [Paracoccaceae bacterium]
MTRETKAHVFIKTLAEMLESQRALKSVRLRRQHKADAERFMQSYRNDPDGGLQPMAWPSEGRQSESGAQRQSWAD